MYCSRCGNKIDDNSNFCPICGEKAIRENNNQLQQDISSKDENINEGKIDLNKYNSKINNDKAEENKEQDKFQNKENRCMYGHKVFEISAQKSTEGTRYETIIIFDETDIKIKKENKKGFRNYNQEYKFNIDDVLYVTNTKHLSVFMMIFTVCATLVCIYSFGIKALFILIIDILFSIYRCIEIGFKNGDKINIIFDGLFGKNDCIEIIEYMNRISEQRISNDKKYSQNVIIKNILSVLAATGIVFGFVIFITLTEGGSTVKIDNPYRDENIEKLYQEINETSSDINNNMSLDNEKDNIQLYEEDNTKLNIEILEGDWSDDEGYAIKITPLYINNLPYKVEAEYTNELEISLYDEDIVYDILFKYIDYNHILVYEYDGQIGDFIKLGDFYRQ